MRFFQRLGEALPIITIAHQIARRQNLWKEPEPGFDDPWTAEAINFRRSDSDDDNIRLIPEVRSTVLQLMQLVNSMRASAVFAMRLPPARHGGVAIDAGYFIVLQAAAGSSATCGDETVPLKAGDLWWYSGSHLALANNSKDDDLIVLYAAIHHD